MILNSIDWSTFIAAAVIGIVGSLTLGTFVGISLSIAFVGGRIVKLLKTIGNDWDSRNGEEAHNQENLP